MKLDDKLRARRMRMELGGSLAAMAILLSAGPLSAEEAQEQEIIVTAHKREQSIMDVGVAVTAMSGSDLRDQGMQSFAAVAEQVPNCNVTVSRGVIPDLNIRGVSGDA